MPTYHAKLHLPGYEKGKGPSVSLDHGGYAAKRGDQITGPFFCYSNAKDLASKIGGIVVRWRDFATETTRDGEFLTKILKAPAPLTLRAA